MYMNIYNISILKFAREALEGYDCYRCYELSHLLGLESSSNMPLRACSDATGRSKIALRACLGATGRSKVPLSACSGTTGRSQVLLWATCRSKLLLEYAAPCVTLLSAALRAARLCSVHGYARVSH